MVMTQPASSIALKINHVVLMAIAFTLPFSLFLNDALIIIFALSSFFVASLDRMIKKDNWRLLLLFSALGFIQLFGMLYTSNIADGIHHLEVKITIVLFPLFLLLIPPLSLKQLDQIFKAFILSCLLCSMVSLVYALYQYFLLDNKAGFNYARYTDIINNNPVYFSMYINFCVAILLYWIISRWDNWKMNIKLSAFFLIAWFSGNLIIMSTRMAIFIFLILFSGGILYFFHERKRLLKGVLLLISCVVIFIAFVVINPKSRDRFQRIQLNENLEGGRNLKWKSAGDIIFRNQHYLWGLGTGDTQDSLQAQYKKNNFMWVYKGKYNVHNEYIESTLRHGILGFGILFACLLIPVVISMRKKNYLYLAFLLIISFSLITESMLTRQKGVVFYAFFNALFSFHLLESKRE